jgi:Neutral/alkaline non-lysosomal ceramidase, N-terminal
MVRYLFSLALLASPSLSHAQDGDTWKAGVAKVKITPEKLMWMSGYAARDKPAEGKLTDLWAKALALEDPNGKRCLLITMDLVGIDRPLSQAVCAEIMKKHGLPREAIILSVSHTHCGPVVRSNLNVMYDLDETQQKYVAEYADLLKTRLIDVADAALKERQAVRLSWGTGQATFAVNRRNNVEKDVPKLRALGKLKGPIDHDVPVLAVRDRDDKVVAVAFGYACHATVLSFYQWCGDYPGYAQDALEKRYPGATALFWAGCGADQNPLPRRSVEVAKEYGHALADAVKRVLDAPMAQLGEGLAMTYAETPLPFAELPTREKLAEDTLSKNKNIARRAHLLLQRIEKGDSLSATYPYPVQVWRLGDKLEWIALGGEVVVDFALRLKPEMAPGRTWVMGYANDVMAYIPSLRVLKEGGYEGGGAMVIYGLPTVWGPRVEETIIEAVHQGIKQIRRR